MNADRTTAFSTSPPDLFVSHEAGNAEVFDIWKILDHTHVIFSPVSFIKMLQSVTGEFTTGKAEFQFCTFKHRTVFDLAVGTGNLFAVVNCTAARASVFFSQIGVAESAVHSAWSYKWFLSWWNHTSLFLLPSFKSGLSRCKDSRNGSGKSHLFHLTFAKWFHLIYSNIRLCDPSELALPFFGSCFIGIPQLWQFL